MARLTVSVTEMRNRFDKYIRRVKSGEVIIITEALGTSPEFWLNLQSNYDLVRFRPKRQVGRLAVAP